MTQEDRAIALLRALNIIEIQYSLNGGGDSGDAEINHIELRDGTTLQALPDLPAGISSTGSIETIDALLDSIVFELPEGDWINNEGGFGTIIIYPFEEDEDRFDVDITFRDEGDYGDDDEDEEGDEYAGDDGDADEPGDGIIVLAARGEDTP